jgi:hypothetical protein
MFLINSIILIKLASMKHSFLLSAFVGITLLGITAPVQAAVLLDFDTAADLDSLDQTSALSPALTWSGSAGVGGGGGVTTSAGTTPGSWLYSPGVFDATQTGVGFTLSYYFQTPETLPTALGAGIASIGLGASESTDINGGPLTDRITLTVLKWNGTEGWALATNNSTSSSSIVGNFSMDPDTWYKLQGVFTQGVNGQWTIQMDLWNYGSDGTGTPVSTASILRGASVHTAYSGVGSSMEASLGIIPFGSSRMAAFDLVESNVVLVPEPTSLSLMFSSLGIACLLYRRRQYRK